MAVRDFLLPDLGEGLEDAEIVAWRVAEGDRIEQNQTLVEVNTAKASVEIPSPWEGVVERLHGAEGDVVAVGAPLVSIRVDEEEGGADGGSSSSAMAQMKSSFEPTPDDQRKHPPAEQAAEGGSDRPRRQAVLVGYGVEHEDEPAMSLSGTARGDAARDEPVAASPPVRRLAKELGVDLARVTGTGPGGRISREDVEAAAKASPVAKAPAASDASAGTNDQRIPLKGIRRLIAEKMTRSATEIPHVTTFLTLDATHLESYRKGLEADSPGTRVTALPVVVRALVEVIAAHRSLNASFDTAAGEIVLHGDIHVGIATDTDRGLLVPVVRHTDRLGVTALAAEIARLVQAAREGRSTPDELTGSTVTVTNVGSFGAEFGTPIINHPESAILALGVIEPRALVVKGAVEARPATTLSLSFDHRVLDGAEAGRALRSLGELLESPDRLAGLPR
jgi:2-oxoisovalerate dehydrogenase E2 component (dihydrolipoyl transacylase)